MKSAFRLRSDVPAAVFESEVKSIKDPRVAPGTGVDVCVDGVDDDDPGVSGPGGEIGELETNGVETCGDDEGNGGVAISDAMANRY